jgi:hypothetical protein
MQFYTTTNLEWQCLVIKKYNIFKQIKAIWLFTDSSRFKGSEKCRIGFKTLNPGP